MDQPVVSLEGDVVGVVVPARTKLSILLNANNNYVAIGMRSLSPDYNVVANAVLTLHPDEWQSISFSYWGPLHTLNRGQLRKLVEANIFKVVTTPYLASDWTAISRFKYKNWGELNQYAVLYERHLTPEYKEYFSFSWIAGARGFNFDEKFWSNASMGNTSDRLRLHVQNRAIGGQGGIKLYGRPSTRLNWFLKVLFAVHGDWIRKGIYLENLGTELVNKRVTRFTTPGTIDVEWGAKFVTNNISLNTSIFYTQFRSIATAPGQMNSGKMDKVSRSRDLVIGGLKAGLQVNW